MLVALVVFIVVVWASRIVSLASIAAAAILPVAALFFEYQSPRSLSKTLVIFSTAIALWVIFRHRANIKRLGAGIEPTFHDDDNTGQREPGEDGDSP
jgi:glycerol-3-phosphate acyltransferase PlsY